MNAERIIETILEVNDTIETIMGPPNFDRKPRLKNITRERHGPLTVAAGRPS